MARRRLPFLSSDCLFHVFLCLDPVSIVRRAAVSRHWRHAVVDNAAEIRRHPWRRADRHLLLGLYHGESDMYPGELAFCHRSSWLPPSAEQHWSDSLPAPSHLPVAQGTMPKLYAPLACSDGLLLVCRGHPSEISVCNPLTGFESSVPRPGDDLVPHPHNYLLHSCHGAEPNPSPDAFQVLAMTTEHDGGGHGILALQNYCSKSGAWGPVFRPKARMPFHRHEYRAAPVLCRGAIHWLCSGVSDCLPGEAKYSNKITRVVAVDMSTRQARMIRLPKQLSMSNKLVSTQKMLMLATSSELGEGERLSVLRTEESRMEISIWLYAGDHGVGGDVDDDDDEEKSWMLRRTVDIRKLVEDAGLAYFWLPCKDWAVLKTRLEWFCPRSKCFIIWVPYLGLFVLDLESTKIQRALGDCHAEHFWPYEIDLTLCFSSMKPFSE